MARKENILFAFYVKLLVFLNQIAVLTIFLTALWIFGDVVGRYFFNRPIPGTMELVKSGILPIVFLGAPYTLFKGGHIRTTIIIMRLPARGAALLESIGSIAGAFIFTLISIYGWEAAMKSFLAREFEGVQLRVPTYPSRFIMVVGSVLLTVQFLIIFARNFRILIEKKGKAA